MLLVVLNHLGCRARRIREASANPSHRVANRFRIQVEQVFGKGARPLKLRTGADESIDPLGVDACGLLRSDQAGSRDFN